MRDLSILFLGLAVILNTINLEEFKMEMEALETSILELQKASK